jgi:hypothetical protein
MSTQGKTNPAPVVGKSARQAANQPAVQFLGRAGYAAKGLVYIIIGVLAGLAALGQGGTTTDRKGAVQAIYEQPYGKILLGLVIIGLLGYAMWCIIQALADTEAKGSELKGIGSRLFYVAVAISYASLALASLNLVTGSSNSGKSSDANAQDWTAQLLKQPFGMFLVIIAGIVGLGAAGYQFYRAYNGKFKDHLELSQIDTQMRKWVIVLGRFGLAARGVVFAIIGIFLIVAALQHNAGEAKGLGGALQELAQQRYGQLLLGLVAAGLLAYGLYSLVEARYRRMIEYRKNS